MSKTLIGYNMNNLCKIFIKKKITFKPTVSVIANSTDLFKQLNRDLYNEILIFSSQEQTRLTSIFNFILNASHLPIYK